MLLGMGVPGRRRLVLSPVTAAAVLIAIGLVGNLATNTVEVNASVLRLACSYCTRDWNGPGDASLPLLYAIFFLVGCASLIFDNASTTSLPAVVSHSQLEQANGRLQAAKSVSEQLVAKPLGGWLFAVAAWAPFLLDASALVLIAILVVTLPGNLNRTSGPPVALRGAIAEGIRWLLHNKLLRTLTLTVSLSNVGVGRGVLDREVDARPGRAIHCPRWRLRSRVTSLNLSKHTSETSQQVRAVRISAHQVHCVAPKCVLFELRPVSAPLGWAARHRRQRRCGLSHRPSVGD